MWCGSRPGIVREPRQKKKSKDVKAEGGEKEEEWVHSEMDSSPTLKMY
jgi:hypothetical protein